MSTYTCVDCPTDANQYERKLLLGRPPKRCELHRTLRARYLLTLFNQSKKKDKVVDHGSADNNQ